MRGVGFILVLWGIGSLVFTGNLFGILLIILGLAVFYFGHNRLMSEISDPDSRVPNRMSAVYLKSAYRNLQTMGVPVSESDFLYLMASTDGQWLIDNYPEVHRMALTSVRKDLAL